MSDPKIKSMRYADAEGTISEIWNPSNILSLLDQMVNSDHSVTGFSDQGAMYTQLSRGPINQPS